MTRVVAISGSLRRSSYNSGLLRAAQELHPKRIEFASIADFPLYDADLEGDGLPPAVQALKDRVAAADGVLLASPEYNNSVPGVAKNAIDWLSRPSGGIRNVFKGKAMAVIGATPGGFGTALAQSAWLPVMRTLGTRIFTDARLLVSSASQRFDDRGNLTDDELRERLDIYLQAFLEFCGADGAGGATDSG